MTLLSGKALNPKSFFSVGSPLVQASSFDLSVGKIFDQNGKQVDGPYTLKPGHMVQVVSTEVFKLGKNVTGHVTYKTTLTRIGVWALTVGIVDPGWDGPIATTLLNFSRNDYTIQPGDAFLRVSLFEHSPVPAEKLRKAPKLDEYYKDVQRLAASMFPPKFLNSDDIERKAGEAVLERIRKEGLVWIGAIALIFTLIQIGARFVPPLPSELTAQAEVTKAQFARMDAELEAMKSLINGLRIKSITAPVEKSQYSNGSR